jgi:hypothetical protein
MTNNFPKRNSKTLSLVAIRLITYDLILTKVRKKIVIPLIALRPAL